MSKSNTLTINQQQQEVLKTEGSILVTANPGTGKTFLLAQKYLSLVQESIEPKNILCLTFTEKAKNEMKERILELQEQNKVQMDLSQLNVHTFHSYSLSNLEERDIIPTNLLKSEIYLHIKENDLFNYTDSYIVSDIVPKVQTLINYLKSFGILPDDIDHKDAEKHCLENADKKYTINEKKQFLRNFIDIYNKYEYFKNSKGYDYTDLLIEFLNLKEKPKFEYVLIDELQDLNKLEAEIALQSAEKFIAVGDKKQAIFGFQGGSINNFELFEEDSEQFILSDNFRSTDQILFFARDYFTTKTKNDSHKEDLQNLKNAENKEGDKPLVIKVEQVNKLKKANRVKCAADLLQTISNDKKDDQETTTAIIMRTNAQLTEMGEELKNRNIQFTTTFFSGSQSTKDDILTFLRGVIASDAQSVKNAMFTPYFPITLQQAFELADKKYGSLKEILDLKELKPFKKLRDNVKNKYDLMKLFLDRIFPIAVSHGKQHYLVAKKVNDAFSEALELLGEKDLDNVFNYINFTDLSIEEAEGEAPVILTTVHKAKGREFNNVIYLPSSPRGKENIVDLTVKSILKSKDIDADEELEEEAYRIDFVALTRAKDKLFVIIDKNHESAYNALNEELYHFQTANFESSEVLEPELNAYKLEAYKMFVNGEYEEAKKLLNDRDCWLKDFICEHFKKMDSVSFSSLEKKPFDYLIGNILKTGVDSPALNLGSQVHSIAENKLKGVDYKTDEEYEPYENNINEIYSEVKSNYPEVHCVEEFFEVPLSDISEITEDIKFKGRIDAVLKKDRKYLMLDWKTNRDNGQASKHRRQLDAYRKAFCYLNKVDQTDVEVAIAYVGLRPAVKTGEISCDLDTTQPQSKVFSTVEKHLKKIVDWKNQPEDFFRELQEEKNYIDNPLWKNVVEQYLYEEEKTNKKPAKNRS